MGFATEATAYAGKRGLAIVSVATTAPPLVLYILSGSLSQAVALCLAVLLAAVLWTAHGFWQERVALEAKTAALEATAGWRVDGLLRRALGLREQLTYRQPELKEIRTAVGELIFDSHMTIEDCAPAYFDDLTTEQIEGAGTQQLLGVVNEYYRVLAVVSKQL